VNPLSPKEIRHAELLLQGMSGVEIAQSMGIKVRTVKMRNWKLFQQFRVPEGVIKHVFLAVKLHDQRHILGIRCQACGEI